MKALTIIGVIGLSTALTGCVVYEQGHAHERPYNDRYEEPDYQSEVRMTWGIGNYYYDPYLDLYVSYGFPSSYWLDGFYFRYTGDMWLRSAHWHGPWVTVTPYYLPRRINTFRDYYTRYPKRYPNKIRLDAYRDHNKGHDNVRSNEGHRANYPKPSRYSDGKDSPKYRDDNKRDGGERAGRARDSDTRSTRDEGHHDAEQQRYNESQKRDQRSEPRGDKKHAATKDKKRAKDGTSKKRYRKHRDSANEAVRSLE